MELSVTDKKETTPYFTSLNPDTGLLETRNSITGDILAVQSSMDENILYAKAERSHLVKVEGQDILVEAGVDLNKLPRSNFKTGGRKTQWIYSTLIGEAICQLITTGFSMNSISKKEGFPSINVILKWKKENSSFKKMLEDAYKDRGEYHRDKALELAEDDAIIKDKDGKPLFDKDGMQLVNTGHRKLQIETHKWLASSDDVSRYGQKTRVDGEVSVKHTIFQIDTGVRRLGDPGYQVDQTKIVQENELKRIGEIDGSVGEGKEDSKTIGRSPAYDGADCLPFKPKE